MSEINNILDEKLKQIRNEKGFVSFVQIGAYDGISMDDVVNQFIYESDKGVFIEPNPNIFNQLRENKKNFKNCKFFDFAVIPNENFFSDFFHVHKSGGGSSFVRGMMNRDAPESDSFELFEVTKVTIGDLVKNYLDFIPDAFFIDCEGYDHDIVSNLIQVQKPELIYFESWDTQNLNIVLGEKVFSTRDDINQLLINNNYKLFFDSLSENTIAII